MPYRTICVSDILIADHIRRLTGLACAYALTSPRIAACYAYEAIDAADRACRPDLARGASALVEVL